MSIVPLFAVHFEWPELLVAAVDMVSAIFGIVGTYFMAKRYAPTFWSGLWIALLALGLRLIGRGENVDQMYNREAEANKDVPDFPADTAFGLNLLFLAFLLQLCKIGLELIVKSK